MASTYTTGFGIEKIGSGEQSGAWGTTTNHNLDILDRIASYKAVALSGSTHTLTVREASPGSGTENLQDGMYRVIKFTGALGANNTVTIAPNTAPAYFIFENATTDSGSSGPYSVILTQGSGANITIQNGKNAIVYCDGAGSGAAVVNALSDLQIATLEVTGAAAIDGAVTVGGILSVDDTTTSTSGTTGSIHTDGGLGVAGTAFVAGAATVGGASQFNSTVTVGVDATGYDVTFFGDTTGRYVKWDESADSLLFSDNAKAIFGQPGNDLQIYHDGSNSSIVDAGTGELLITTNGTFIRLGTTAGDAMVDGVKDGAVSLYYDNAVKLATVTGGVAVTGDLTATGTVEPAGDTAAGDNAALGYTSVLGAILTGQGSTNDVTLVNDADATVIGIPTGTTNVAVTGDLTANNFAGRNRIINGAMTIDQRNAGASVTPAHGSYTLDHWECFNNPAGKFSVQQNAGSVTPPAGFANYFGVTSLSAYTVTGSNSFTINTKIEGYNFSDMAWGTASAATITLSFWVRSSLTGTFGGALRNSADNRSYPFTYTISVANTWEQKAVTIAGDTTGTWIGATNGVGLRLHIGLGVGSTYSGSAGSWAAANYLSASGATSVVGTSGATFYITGVQLEKSSTATEFEYKPYGTELALCQRYYQLTNSAQAATIETSETTCVTALGVIVPMRANPTIAAIAASFHRPGIAFYAATSPDAAPNATGQGYSGFTIAAGAGTSRNGQITGTVSLTAEL